MLGVLKMLFGGRMVSHLALAIFLGLAFQYSAAASSSLTIGWNQSTNADVIGYNIYYGTTSGDYTNVVTVGNTTSAVISGIIPGTTYYFAATSYTSSGQESVYSPQVSYTVPTTIPAGNQITSTLYAGNQFSFDVAGTSGSKYVVEASTNLVTWVPVATNTAPFTFVDPNAAHYSKRFYTAVLQ